MVVALQSYLNDLTEVESNIRRSARILVFNPQPWPADPKIAYMHANISQIKTARIHYIFKVFKPRRVCCRALARHAYHFERSANQAHTCLGIFFFCDKRSLGVTNGLCEHSRTCEHCDFFTTTSRDKKFACEQQRV